MKKCPRCKEEKPKTEFHKSNTRLDKLAVYCKVCEKVRRVKEKDAYKDLYGLI